VFGISLGELFFTITIAGLIIGPKDFPEVARQIIKIIAKTKHIVTKAKAELNIISKEVGLDEIQNQVAIELANERSKIEKEIITIIDIYGNEHQINNSHIDKTDENKEDMEREIVKYNLINKEKSLNS
jgi:Sec-independent protein translocase protein TatA